MKSPKFYKCLHCDEKVPYPPLAIEGWNTEMSHYCTWCNCLNKLYQGKAITKDYHTDVNREPSHIYL